ncbi:MAG: FtsX-like permease family protein [Gammaproteobacteria bacterium]|nr:FtsX-like permease family protein [Gammaproteobacteria bacterium]
MISAFIGYRYAKIRGESASLISFVSSLAGRGLALSVAVLVVVVSIINGFERELEERILNLTPQVELTRLGGIDDWQSVRDQLVDGVSITEAAPFISSQGLAKVGSTTQPVLLYGVNPVAEQRISPLDSFIVSGSIDALSVDSQVLIGRRLASAFNVDIGDRISFLQIENVRAAPRLVVLTVGAIAETGTQLDSSMLIASLSTASLITGRDSVDGIKLKVDDVYNAHTIGYLAASVLGEGFTSKSWLVTYRNLAFAIQSSRQMIWLLLILIIAIATFNVVTTLVMVVIEKKRDVAILRTMGASRGTCLKIFMAQGAFIGMIYTTIGILSGGVIALLIPWGVVAWESLTGQAVLDSSIYPVSFIPVSVEWLDLLGIFTLSVLLSLFASLFPAWRATKVVPAKVLQHSD